MSGAVASERIALAVNGSPVELRSPGGARLLDALRIELGLTGTKEGCGEGECGACSVLVDGELVASCLVPVAQVSGCEVQTVEGLAPDGRPDRLQEAFLAAGAAQCGICTPGMLMAGRAFLASGEAATEEAIREAISGNLCRCTGYTKIVEAIELAAASEPVRPAAAAAPVEWSAPGVDWAVSPTDPLAAHRAATLAPPAGVAGVRDATGPDISVPSTLAEALVMLAGHPRPRPIAGGTDLMVGLATGAFAPDGPLLGLWDVPELRGIRAFDDRLEIGAGETFSDLLRSAPVRERAGVLADAAATIGAVQIRNRATLGGNAVNASPAGDSLPVLLALDASLVVASVRGERAIAAADFWPGYRRTALAPDELLVRIVIPSAAGRQARFRKVGTRRAQAISKVVMAVAWREEDGAWRDVRVALGSVAEVPLRAVRTEAALEGARPDAATADRAAVMLFEEVRPIDDVRSTAAYRRAVAARVLHRILRAAGGW